VQNKH